METLTETEAEKGKKLLREMREHMKKIDELRDNIKKERFTISEKKGVMLEEISVPSLEILSDKPEKKKDK